MMCIIVRSALRVQHIDDHNAEITDKVNLDYESSIFHRTQKELQDCGEFKSVDRVPNTIDVCWDGRYFHCWSVCCRKKFNPIHHLYQIIGIDIQVWDYSEHLAIPSF